MPYIKPIRRRALDGGGDARPQDVGELNYAITMLIKDYLARCGGTNYATLNGVIGVLECAKQELYRRMVAPYEDTKIKENGAAGMEVLSGCAVRATIQLEQASPSAVISDDGIYRYRLDRPVALRGIVIAFFGVNGSTATGDEEDQTTRKWFGFASRNGASRYIAGNPFAFRATDVTALGRAADPVGPENPRYLAEIIAEADLLVPCWGNRGKVPKHLRGHFDKLRAQLFASGKQVKIFGLTKGGDPLHPLMLGYDTALVPWQQ